LTPIITIYGRLRVGVVREEREKDVREEEEGPKRMGT